MAATTVSQVPPPVDLEFIAGNPFTLSVTCTGATISSPVVTMRTAGGDVYTTNPGTPAVSVATNVITVAYGTDDSSALNATSRSKEFLWSLQALVNGAGPFELLARRIKVLPTGASGGTTSTDLDLAVTVGSQAITLALTIGPGASTTCVALADGSTVTLNASLGRTFRVTLGGNRTLAITNPTDGQVIDLEIKQDGTGARTLTLPTGSGGVSFSTDAPSSLYVLTTTAGAVDILTLKYNATAARWWPVSLIRGF